MDSHPCLTSLYTIYHDTGAHAYDLHGSVENLSFTLTEQNSMSAEFANELDDSVLGCAAHHTSAPAQSGPLTLTLRSKSPNNSNASTRNSL